MSQSAQTPADKVKEEVFQMLQDAATLAPNANDAAEEIWASTLGSFFAEGGDEAAAKWRLAAVKNYGLSAVRDLIDEAKRLAGGNKVSAANLRSAAKTIIGKYRPPVEINEGVLSCELCARYKMMP